MMDYSSSKSMANNEQCVMDYQHNKSMILQNVNIDPNLVGNSNLLNKDKIFEIQNTKICNNDISKVDDEKLRHEVDDILNLKDVNETHHLIGKKFVELKGESQVHIFEQGQHISQHDFKISPSKCKRCKNITSLGKFEPCWTCANKNNNTILFKKMKNEKIEDIIPILQQSHTFDLSSKGNINANKKFIMPSNESKRYFNFL